MKPFTSIFGLLLAITLTFSFVDAFAAKTQVKIKATTETAGGPQTRTEPVLCFADTEASYVEVMFRRNFGEVQITITDSNGAVVAETSLDTSVENFVMLNIPTSDDNYTIEIEGDGYLGVGTIY